MILENLLNGNNCDRKKGLKISKSKDINITKTIYTGFKRKEKQTPKYNTFAVKLYFY